MINKPALYSHTVTAQRPKIHTKYRRFVPIKKVSDRTSSCEARVSSLRCERNTCSAHYRPRATAGTYVTSFLILLMWKEEAPLLSPDLLIAEP